MDKKLKSSFKFIDYEYENLNMVLNHDYNKYRELDEQPLSVTVKLEVQLSDDLNRAIIKLHFGVFEDVDKDYPYKISVLMVGSFELEGNWNKEKATTYCKLNGTAIMFPYIRSAVTDLTKIANVDPLILPAINIHNLIKSQE